MNPIDEVTRAIERVDKQRTALCEAQFYLRQIQAYARDNNLDTWLLGDEDIFADLEAIYADKLLEAAQLREPARSALHFVKRLDAETNEIIDPSLSSLILSALLRSVDYDDWYADRLKRRIYEDFFDRFYDEMCSRETVSSKRSKTK